MTFRQPFNLPKLLKKGKNENQIDLKIQQFDCNKLPVKQRIALGSFGEVYTTDYRVPGDGNTQTVVIKKMLQVLDQEEKNLFFKEVALLNDLHHKNIVEFKAVCCKPYAMMLQYVYFDFKPFGEDVRLSSLSDFLLKIDEHDCKGFEDLLIHAGKEIIQGLSYLHSKQIAHRDLLVDIWALGMIFFSMVNPSLRYPFSLEIRSAQIKKKEEMKKFICCLLQQKNHPSPDRKYEVERATVWHGLEEVYRGCVKFETHSRLSLAEASAILNLGNREDLDKYDVMHLKVSQSTAVEQFDHQFAVHAGNRNKLPASVESIPNDGTNACAFLCVKISDTILADCRTDDDKLAGLGEIVEDTILTLPAKINACRDLNRMYDPMEAYKMLKAQKLLRSSYDFSEELPFLDSVFSFEGRQKLNNKLCHLGRKDFVAIYVSDPLVLTIGCLNFRPFIIDTHPVTLAPGKGNGLILIGKDNSSEVWKSLCVWLSHRLYHGGVKLDKLQSLAVMTPQSCLKRTVESTIEDVESQSPQQRPRMDKCKPMPSESKLSKDNTLDDQVASRVTKSGAFSVVPPIPVDDWTSEVLDSSDEAFGITNLNESTNARGTDTPVIDLEDHDKDEQTMNRQKRARVVENDLFDNSPAEEKLDQDKDEQTMNRQKRARVVENEIIVLDSDDSSAEETLDQTSKNRDKHPSASHEDEDLPSTSHADEDLPSRNLFKLFKDKFGRFQKNDSEPVFCESKTDAPKDAEPSFYKGNKETPIFEELTTGYTVMGAIKILIKDYPERMKCTTTPLRVRRNMSFLMNIDHFDRWEDVKSDLNGIYRFTQRVCTWQVEVVGNNVGIVEKKKASGSLANDNHFHIHVHSMKNEAGLCRTIFFLMNIDEAIVNSTCLLSYHVLKKGCTEVDFKVSSHGNRKLKGKPFFPLKKSTIENIRMQLILNPPVLAFKNISEAAGGALAAKNPGDLPRSKQQVYDVKCKDRKTDDIDELLQYVKHTDESFVLEHHDIPEDLWVFAKPHMTADIARFCTSERLNHPLSVDPTFNFGAFEVTPFTYKHLFLTCNRTGAAPSFIGATAIHYSKEKRVYKKIAHAVANASPNLAHKIKGFITDGEESLYASLHEEMRNATGLRCFRHFFQNCKEKLHQLGIQKKSEQKFFLDKVFGTDRSKGLLDAADETEFQSLMLASKDAIDLEEARLTDEETGRFWSYIQKHKQMMVNCMIAPVRRKAGMPLNNEGIPLKSYTNQSESINNKLTRKKEAMTKNDKAKVNMTKLQFTKNVWEEVDKDQQHDLQLAICGLSELYELAEIVSYLEVPADEWFTMNEHERSEYVKRFNSMSVDDALKKKEIKVTHIPNTEENEFIEFSLDVRESLKSINAWSDDLLDFVVNEATALLNNKDAVQRMPSIEAGKRHKYLVAAKTCKKGMYECSVYKDHIKCSCPCYKSSNLCKHSLCVAEVEKLLKEHLHYMKRVPKCKNPSRSNLIQSAKEGQGKKGGSHKNPWRCRQPSGLPEQLDSDRPFTEIYHNNRPLYVRFLYDLPNVPSAKECKLCRIEFPVKKNTAPYDIVLSHEERWMWKPKTSGDQDPRPSCKFTTKYYCIKRNCIRSRFPYFYRDPTLYLEIPGEVRSCLKDIHWDLLKTELNFEA